MQRAWQRGSQEQAGQQRPPPIRSDAEMADDRERAAFERDQANNAAYQARSGQAKSREEQIRALQEKQAGPDREFSQPVGRAQQGRAQQAQQGRAQAHTNQSTADYFSDRQEDAGASKARARADEQHRANQAAYAQAQQQPKTREEQIRALQAKQAGPDQEFSQPIGQGQGRGQGRAQQAPAHVNKSTADYFGDRQDEKASRAKNEQFKRMQEADARARKGGAAQQPERALSRAEKIARLQEQASAAPPPAATAAAGGWTDPADAPIHGGAKKGGHVNKSTAEHFGAGREESDARAKDGKNARFKALQEQDARDRAERAKKGPVKGNRFEG